MGDTCLQQPSPAEATFQPLGEHGVALDVDTQLLWCEPSPDIPRASNGYAIRINDSDFDTSVFDAVLLRRRTVARFETKPHAFQCHGLTSFNFQSIIRIDSEPNIWQYSGFLRLGQARYVSGRNM